MCGTWNFLFFFGNALLSIKESPTPPKISGVKPIGFKVSAPL